ncbi:Polyamine aminopropyltransferase [Tepidimonas sediminis]|uniref:Polyamine aminopropyltransferase n=1 Tax=Tepidimonas sediminis TaxID=2588941 RepID=A0A554WNB7_9BURK|nr:fused MFS/spermidine synthase [Tepidimonas sediminis]TSE25074.1 Polyamine aminopropyltransferase [Tepidimonas sediminis]
MKTATPAWVVSALVGFASLGQEILWIRIVGFANGNSPQTFSLVLSLFLFGIALGSLAGKRACDNQPPDAIQTFGARSLFLSGVVDLSAAWLIILAAGNFLLIPIMACIIIATAASKAALFPVVHHLGGTLGAADTGRSIAWIYFANIIGATAAPLFIGFWWLDRMTSQSIMLALGAITAATGGLLAPKLSRRVALSATGIGGVIAVILTAPHTALYTALTNPTAEQSVGFLLENRHGVIHTLTQPAADETVYGGNVYDGKINIDLINNSNRIDRVYLLAALHPEPRRILVIGLSGGSWTRVLSSLPSVERIDAIELNPGYIYLISQRPTVEPILRDDRVRIHIDDGRRWLRRNPTERYDLIVMNTTFHWRALATNLLSREFLDLARTHLETNGILAFNATGSPDALKTAATVFPFAFRWKDSTFIYAANYDFTSIDHLAARQRIKKVVKNLYMSDKYDEKRLSETIDGLLSKPWISVEEEEKLVGRALETITDQNMITEYRYGRSARR